MFVGDFDWLRVYVDSDQRDFRSFVKEWKTSGDKVGWIRFEGMKGLAQIN